MVIRPEKQGRIANPSYTKLRKLFLRGREARVERGVQACPNQEDYQAQGQKIAIAFLGRIPALRRRLATDVQAAHEGDPACTGSDEVVLCYPGLEAVTVYRLAHELYRLNVPFIPRMMTEWAHRETGIDIHPGAVIGQYFDLGAWI